MWLDDDLDILIERHEKARKAFDGKPPELAAQQLGHIGLADAEQTGGIGLFQAALLHERVNLEDELRLDHVLPRIRQAEIPEHVPAADFVLFLAHCSLSLSIRSTSRRRRLTSSMSRRGVSRPVCDFFRKA